MIKNKLFFMVAGILLCCSSLTANAADVARKILWDAAWRFSLGDTPAAQQPTFDDASWRQLTLPHDWSIEQPITKDAPSGNDGGYYPTGIGWYRKTFNVPKSFQGEKVFLYFEGAYMNSTVYVNGKEVGGHPYGYTSFFCDITEAITVGKRNVVAVRIDNSGQKNCRWYSGSGLYRHVWLIHTPYLYIGNWGISVTTPEVSQEQATVNVRTTVKNDSDKPRNLQVRIAVGDKAVTSPALTIPAHSQEEVAQEITLTQPQLWSIRQPHLYQAKVSIVENGKVIDSHTQAFGVRKLEFSTQGFFLNGEKIDISGGCVHHDNGLLGAAAFDRAEERKVRLMKDAGFNAIRTSHNLPSEAFLNACDRLGMLVIDEAFDGWRDAKTKHDYSTLFDKYWQDDVSAMVLRDRNHPSIIAWSIGNEVIERKKIEVVTTARKLANMVRQYDNRPVTSALASWDKDWEIYDPLAAELDIVGYNYLIHKSEADHERVPNRVMWQTESYPRDAFRNWEKVHDNSYILGDFVWTGIDYLGESGIGRWWYEGDVPGEHYQRDLYPWHAAYCGDIDLTGWRKPISHYRSLLYNDTEKLYMAVKEPNSYQGTIKTGLWAVHPTWECWNWEGHEGKNIEVEVYAKYPTVRLYLNNQLQDEKAVGRDTEYKAVFTLPYQAGTLRVEALENGEVKETRQLVTASEPCAIRATVENSMLQANGQDLAFVQVEVIDKDGNVCPQAAIDMKAAVSGQGTLAAAGSGDIKDTDSSIDGNFKTWKGRALVVVRSTHKKGKAKLTLSAPQLGTTIKTFLNN